jgi:hypothetical protein
VNRHQFELPLGSGIDRGMTIVQYGNYGRPVLVFPSEAGRAWDFENNGMLEAIGNLINDGRVKLYCVDSLDVDTWADKALPLEERALRHEVYTRWLTHHVVPHIHSDTSPAAELITLGCSLGAYHAVHFSMQRADLAPLSIGLSGNYDVSTWGSWGDAAMPRTSPIQPTTCPTCTVIIWIGCGDICRSCWWSGRVPGRLIPQGRCRPRSGSRPCSKRRASTANSISGATTSVTTGNGGSVS